MCAGRAGKGLSSSFHFFFCCGRASGNLHAEPDLFPVTPEAVLTRTHYIKGRPHENLLSPFPACPVTLTSFLPSLSSPLKNKLVGTGNESDAELYYVLSLCLYSVTLECRQYDS